VHSIVRIPRSVDDIYNWVLSFKSNGRRQVIAFGVVAASSVSGRLETKHASKTCSLLIQIVSMCLFLKCFP
jgi:hypothetical protein